MAHIGGWRGRGHRISAAIVRRRKAASSEETGSLLANLKGQRDHIVDDYYSAYSTSYFRGAAQLTRCSAGVERSRDIAFAAACW